MKIYYSENQFRAIIIRVVNLLRLSGDHTAIWRVYDYEWRRRLRRMVCVHLNRMFRWVLSCCSIREIKRLYHLIFRENKLAVSTAAEFILLRDLHQMAPLQCLMAEYNEYVGK